MKCYQFMHVMKMLRFENNQNLPDRSNPEYDRLWKIRRIFDNLNNIYITLNHPTENWALDDVIVKFKGIAVFQQYIPKKHTKFGIKLYKLCDGNGYMHDMAVC